MAKIEFPRSTPEEQGIPSQSIVAFLEACDESKLELHSFMFVRHGHVVAEGWWHPYAADIPHMMYSLSKSFTSTAIGFAVTEGRLTVDDEVVSFFGEYVTPEIEKNMGGMRVRHLLSMSTGHAEDTYDRIQDDAQGDWVHGFLNLPIQHEPGTHFLYNTGATYMLSAIVQKVTGQTLVEYLQPRLFEPLGIADPYWAKCPKGINLGGTGLRIRTEDIAKLGQLYLQRGRWNGEVLLPEAWVDEASQKHINNGNDVNSDWAQGYGYQFWRCKHGVYRGDGAFGQYCIVMPQYDAVVAITSGVNDMQAVMNHVWTYLLGSMKEEQISGDTARDVEVLQQKLASLAIRPAVEAVGALPSPQNSWSGTGYQLDDNRLGLRSLTLSWNERGFSLDLANQNGSFRLPGSYSEWAYGTAPDLEDANRQTRVAVHGAWRSDDTFVVTVQYFETPYALTLACRFEGDSLDASGGFNVGFDPAMTSLQLHGVATR